MMRAHILLSLLAAVSILLVCQESNATSLGQRLLIRRQSGEQEKESTTSSSSNNVPGSNNNVANSQQPARLYPDLPQQPGNPMFGQPFGGGPQAFQPNFHGAPTPFTPFSPQLTPGQLSDLQRRMQPRPMMSPTERLQSQTFTDGLGRRLLSMIGLDQGGSQNETDPLSRSSDTMKALQNATILQQLNGGVQSIYGGLSKMYNSTVQQQLNLLQDRFKKETENSTNPWQQRMTQQVPQFFMSMAAKVGEAQEGLNRIWKQMVQQANNNATTDRTDNPNPNQRSFFNSFDQFINQNPGSSSNFFNQFGFNDGQQQARDLGSQLMGFWHNQVQPQIGMVRGQIARVWRDLTTSGVLTPDSIIRSRNMNGLGAGNPSSGNDNATSGVVDEILKEVDMGNAEYSLIDSKSDQGDSSSSNQKPILSLQMQNRLIAMQRELNQLWGGLTNSLQNAIGNVRSTLNPRPPQFGPPTPMDANNNRKEVDPDENEIVSKVKDLGKLQRDADTVHDVVQQQQQNQMRPSFGASFRNFVNQVDFDQLPGRFSDSMARFGTAVGDLWNQIPRRWDNFMDNMSPDVARSRLTASSTTTTQKPTTTMTDSAS